MGNFRKGLHSHPGGWSFLSAYFTEIKLQNYFKTIGSLLRPVTKRFVVLF
jgi:hypothetical protein